MIATDSFKALKSRTGRSVAEIRDIARDLGLQVAYRTDRRTWVLDEDATTVRFFNEHLGA